MLEWCGDKEGGEAQRNLAGSHRGNWDTADGLHVRKKAKARDTGIGLQRHRLICRKAW